MCLYVGGCLAGGKSPTDREARGPSASARQVGKPSDWDIILSLPKSKTALSIVRTINVFLLCFQQYVSKIRRLQLEGEKTGIPTDLSNIALKPLTLAQQLTHIELQVRSQSAFDFTVDTYFVLLRQKIFLVSHNANRKICRKCACHGYVVGKRKVGNFSPNHRLILVLMSRFLGHVIMDTYI